MEGFEENGQMGEGIELHPQLYLPLRLSLFKYFTSALKNIDAEELHDAIIQSITQASNIEDLLEAIAIVSPETAQLVRDRISSLRADINQEKGINAFLTVLAQDQAVEISNQDIWIAALQQMLGDLVQSTAVTIQNAQRDASLQWLSRIAIITKAIQDVQAQNTRYQEIIESLNQIIDNQIQDDQDRKALISDLFLKLNGTVLEINTLRQYVDRLEKTVRVLAFIMTQSDRADLTPGMKAVISLAKQIIPMNSLSHDPLANDRDMSDAIQFVDQKFTDILGSQYRSQFGFRPPLNTSVEATKHRIVTNTDGVLTYADRQLDEAALLALMQSPDELHDFLGVVKELYTQAQEACAFIQTIQKMLLVQSVARHAEAIQLRSEKRMNKQLVAQNQELHTHNENLHMLLDRYEEKLGELRNENKTHKDRLSGADADIRSINSLGKVYFKTELDSKFQFVQLLVDIYTEFQAAGNNPQLRAHAVVRCVERYPAQLMCHKHGYEVFKILQNSTLSPYDKGKKIHTLITSLHEILKRITQECTKAHHGTLFTQNLQNIYALSAQFDDAVINCNSLT